jgi:hypothetical protein
MKYAALIALLFLGACDECKPPKKEVFAYYITTFILVGKVMVPQMIPIYECRSED